MAEIKLPVLIGSIAATAVLSAGLSVGGVLLLGGGGDAGAHGEEPQAQEAEAAPPPPSPIYHGIEPTLLVNFDRPTGPKYLQIAVQVMTRHEAVIAKLEEYMPAIRNDLIFLLSAQDPSELRSQEGKTMLRARVLEAVQAIVGEVSVEDEDHEGDALHFGVEDVYFTNFVMQ